MERNNRYEQMLLHMSYKITVVMAGQDRTKLIGYITQPNIRERCKHI